MTLEDELQHLLNAQHDDLMMLNVWTNTEAQTELKIEEAIFDYCARLQDVIESRHTLILVLARKLKCE